LLAPEIQDSDDFEAASVVICRSLTMCEVEKYYQNHDGERLRCKCSPGESYDPNNDPFPDADPKTIIGDPVATEFPIPLHEIGSRQVTLGLVFSLSEMGLRHVYSIGSILCRIGQISKQPEDSLIPEGFQVGGIVTVKSTHGNDFPIPN
jgi:hypothetical protein